MKQVGLEAPKSAIYSMEDVQQQIESRRELFASHGFLLALEGPATLAQFKGFVPRLAFFVMCFQDILRVIQSLCSDPAIKAVASVHASEDKGHDQWYLADVKRLGIALDVPMLFSESHRLTRDVVYRQIAHVVSAKHDASRLAVALALEAVGAECFHRAIGMLERLQCADGLQYFARNHQAVEESHAVFEGQAQSRLAQIVISGEAWDEALEAVDTTFSGMTALMTELQSAFTAGAT